MTFRLRNPKYYVATFLKIQKFMKIEEKHKKVHEEVSHMLCFYMSHLLLKHFV